MLAFDADEAELPRLARVIVLVGVIDDLRLDQSLDGPRNNDLPLLQQEPELIDGKQDRVFILEELEVVGDAGNASGDTTTRKGGIEQPKRLSLGEHPSEVEC